MLGLPTNRVLGNNGKLGCRYLKKCQQEFFMTDTPLGYHLKATGTIHVSLVLNFRHFVDRVQKKKFDRLRGSLDYQQTLDALAEHVLEKVVQSRQAGQNDQSYPFELEDKEHELQDIAVDIRVFRHQTAKAAFTPVYWLNKKEGDNFEPSSTLRYRLPNGNDLMKTNFEGKLREEWEKWTHRGIQLTRDGLVHIRLEQSFEKSNLLGVLEKVVGLQDDPVEDRRQDIQALIDEDDLDAAMELIRQRKYQQGRRQFREQLDRSIQWEIAMALIERFIEVTFEKRDDNYFFPKLKSDSEFFDLKLHRGGTRSIPPYNDGEELKNRKDEDPIYPLHDRYVTYVFEELRAPSQKEYTDKENDNSEHQTIPCDYVVTWADLDPKSKREKPYGKEIACLLEGVMIEEEQRKTKRFPELKKREIYQGLRLELSSWEAELCLLSQDNAVIYYYSDPKIHFSHRPNVPYEDYWRCILRGFEYILELRLLALLVAETSTEDLARLADLLVETDKEQNSQNGFKKQEIKDLRERMATNTRLIGHLRDATSPFFIASADYATRKFDRFIKISGLRRMIGNAEGDIQAINDFLKHHDALTEQKSEAHRNRRFTQVAMLLSLVAIVLSFFEFLSFVIALLNSDSWVIMIMVLLGVLILSAFVAVGLFWLRKQKNQQLLLSLVSTSDEMEEL